MLSRSGINSLILVLASVFTLGGCVTIYNPATQRKETLLIDTQSEVSLGKGMDQEIQKKLKIVDDFKINQRLNNIGGKIALSSDRQDLRYYFRVVKDKELNAFAIPGGYVYVHGALMEIASDDELAGVLAHEIGHIAARHSVKKLQAAMAYELLRSIVLGLTRKEAIVQAVDVMVFNPATLAYSRQDELLADKLAVRYSMKSGFNPRGIITFFEKLKKEQAEKGAALRIEILSSHPDLDERIKKVEQEISLNP